MKSRKRIRRIRCFFTVMVLCLIPVGREFYLSIKHKEQRDALREKVEQSENLEISGGQTAEGIQASGGAAAGNGTGGNGKESGGAEGNGEEPGGVSGDAGGNDENGQQTVPHPAIL